LERSSRKIGRLEHAGALCLNRLPGVPGILRY